MKGDRISSALSKSSRGNMSVAKGGLLGAVEMTQWVKVMAVKSSDLSSISRTHKLFSDQHTHTHACPHTKHINTRKIYF